MPNNTASINLPNVTLADIPQILRMHYDLRIPVLLMGPPGIGKSQSVVQFVDEMRKEIPDFQYVDKRVAGADPGDIQGRQFYNTTTSSLTHVAPEDWPTDPESSGVYILEELADGTRLSTSAVYSILQERKIADKELPDGWWVVGCCNRPDDGSNARAITTALADRVAIYNVVADFDSFSKWALANEVHPAVLSYLRSHPHQLEGNQEQVSKGRLVAPSPRSWYQVSELLKHNLCQDSTLKFPIVASKLGDGVAIELLAHLEDDCEDVDVVGMMKAKTKSAIKKLLPKKINKLVFMVYAIHNLADTHSEFEQALTILSTLIEKTEAEAEGSNAGEVVAFAVEMLIIKYMSTPMEDKVDDITKLLTPHHELISLGQG